MAFAGGLWLAPKIFGYYKRKGQIVPEEKTEYHRSWKTTLFAILTVHGFGLAIGFILFGYVVGSQPPSTYPVFGYGKPPPIVIDGFNSYYWAIPSVIAGLTFLYLTIRSRRKDNRLDQISPA